MIGVIDSGSGGVNVINECLKYYNQDFVYLVDNKNCPYGNKPPEDLKEIIKNNINMLLNKYDIDFLILGCNTASSILDYKDLENIRCPVLKTYPDLKSLAMKKEESLLFATKNTLKQSKYVKYYLLNYDNIKTLYIKDFPKDIDEYLSKNKVECEQECEKLLKKAFFNNKKLKNRYKGIKNIALGCTHFKHIKGKIEAVFNNSVKLYYCEKQVALISKFLVKRNKKSTTVKILLTSPDNNLKRTILNLIKTR